MDLARDSDRLKMDTISADLTLSADGNRYLLVILDSQSKAVVLNSVTAPPNAESPSLRALSLMRRRTRFQMRKPFGAGPGLSR